VNTNGWVALLRGINVGGRNSVPMAELRRLFEETGSGSVRTYIQSGNVVFTNASSDRAGLARGLERAVEETFGLSRSVVLRTFDEIDRLAGSHPFGRDSSKTHVAFLSQRPSAGKLRGLTGLDIAPDRFEVAGSDVFLHYPNGVQGSRLTGALLERHLGVAATLRNWRTVLKLAELARATETS
jgi:uncharacterized protein (DUF1697 family)